MHSSTANQTKPGGNVAVALAATFVIHASVVAGVMWGGWLNVAKASTPANPEHRLVTINLTAKTEKTPSETENQFVPVNPETKSEAPPEEKTPFYSNANSIAANPEAPKTPKDAPRIKEGTATAPGNLDNPILSPSATIPAIQPDMQASSKLNLSHPYGTAGAKPKSLKQNFRAFDPASIRTPTMDPVIPLASDKAKSESTADSNTKSQLLPRLPEAPTLSEVKAGLGSRSMKQDGGATRRGSPALDVRLTGFGNYDARFFAAISIAWRKQIKDRTWTSSRAVVDFNLYHDGRIDSLTVRETNAAAILQYYCREAIRRPSPFEPWTKDMRRQLGKGPRHCRITFNYLVR